MNLNITNLAIFGAACVLLYSGITCRNPIQVVKYGLQGKIAPTECDKKASGSSSTTSKKTPGKIQFPTERQTTNPAPAPPPNPKPPPIPLD